MHNRAIRILTPILLAACLISAAPGHGAGTRTVDIEIRSGKVVGKNAVRVTRGDTVELRWVSDQPLELHLHGYDVTTRVVPGTPAAMKLRAHATGRFPVEIHGERKSSGGHSHGAKPLFYLEVYPD
jgi:hypothetical protein